MHYFKKQYFKILLTITLFIITLLQQTEHVKAKTFIAEKIAQLSLAIEDDLYGKGRQMYRISNYKGALELWLQALSAYRKSNNLIKVSLTLSNICFAYSNLSEYKQALSYCEEGLSIARQINNPDMESLALYAIGTVYSGQGNSANTIKSYEQSLIVSRRVGDRRTESQTLRALANEYYKQAKYAKAIEVLQQSLGISKEILDLREQGRIWMDIGDLYGQLGDRKQMFLAYQESLKIVNQLEDKSDVALVLLRLGNISENPEQAVLYWQQSLAIAKKNGNRDLELILLTALDKVNPEKLIHFFRESGARDKEAFGISSRGVECENRNDYICAINSYQQSLIIRKETGNRSDEIKSLNDIARVLERQNQIELAILFLKQSVNVTESIRKDLSKLPRTLQESYTAKVSDTYRHLADLLLQKNRVLEAQRVLDLLKVQELEDFLRGVRSNPNTERGIENLPPEQQINQGYQKLIDQAVAIGKELTELRRIKPKERTIAQEQRIAQLDQQQTELVKEFIKFIDSDEVKALLKKLEAIAFNQQDLLSKLSEFIALQDNLRNLQQDAVLFYPLILDNRLELVLVTPYSPPIRRTVNVTSKELNQTIADFRSALENPRIDATKPAQKLYDWLIKPIEKDLDTANTKTIIYAPDGQLRYIPLAALHNGKQWLVERYRVNNITAASLTDLNTKPQRELSVLAGAYTTSGKKHNFAIGDEQFNFAGLSYAEMEVTKLAETIPETTQLRDEGFSFIATKPQMNSYPIVHFATHAAFLKGQPEKSFILFGNGDRISLTDIKKGAFGSLTNVDLFVLSACETGVGGNFGTGAEILGFGYLMQTAGARAALASLWKVNDSGTQALMNTFYATLANNAITKAEALRQAQIALITGNYKTVAGSRGQMVAIERRIRQGLPNDVANNLSHPYYWASFILIGNGL